MLAMLLWVASFHVSPGWESPGWESPGIHTSRPDWTGIFFVAGFFRLLSGHSWVVGWKPRSLMGEWLSVAEESGKDSSVCPGCPSSWEASCDGFLTLVTASPWACRTEPRVGSAVAV